MNEDRTRLYLISPPELDPAVFSSDLETALKAEGNLIASFQLRLKGAADDDIRTATKMLMPLCHAHDVAFILNDRVDLAKELNTDGVHLGPDDMDVKEARDMLGHDVTIGYSAKASRHEAFTGGDKGADYIAFGAFFPTGTKETPDIRPTPEILAWWRDIAELPSVAIGGITPDNCGPLITAGADFLAVSSGIWSYPDGPAAAIKAFSAAIDKSLE